MRGENATVSAKSPNRLLDAPEMVDPISDLRAGTVARQGKARFSGPSGDASVIGVSPGLPISQKETAMMNNHVDEHLIEAAKEQAHEAAEEAAKEAAQKAYRGLQRGLATSPLRHETKTRVG